MASNRDTHPAVVAARAVAAQLDERTRLDRAANCLTHGHPYGEAVETGFGRFCPHCCTFLDPEPAAKEPETPELSAEVAAERVRIRREAMNEDEKPAANPKPAPKKPTRGAKTSH